MASKALLVASLGAALALYFLSARIAQASGYADVPAIAPGDPGNPEANVIAFLALIRAAESRNDYGALAGGGDFSDFSDHPANLGWPGIRVDAGHISTAAGGYQITQSTWNPIARTLGLPDFSPASQDAAAIYILQYKRAGAYELIAAGKFNDAVARLRLEWQSFDKMLDGSYSITLADARSIYENAGGTVA